MALFADLVLSPLGLRVSAWSRLPYLSRQIGGGVAVLDDALFCLAIDGAAGEGGQGAASATKAASGPHAEGCWRGVRRASA